VALTSENMKQEVDSPGSWGILIIAPVLGGLVFMVLVSLMVFANLARRQRSLYGHYSPQKQELVAPRLELDLVLKPPKEERLI